jgi:thioester reductase-like protein
VFHAKFYHAVRCIRTYDAERFVKSVTHDVARNEVLDIPQSDRKAGLSGLSILLRRYKYTFRDSPIKRMNIISTYQQSTTRMNGQTPYCEHSSSDTAAFTLDRLASERAAKYPERTWTSIPTSSDLSTGWKHITYEQFAFAIDGFARFVEKTHGPGERGAVVAFMGLNDECHTTAVIGLIKAGYTVLLPSPRNSVEHQSSLFEATGSSCLFYDSGMERQAEVVRHAKLETRTYKIPSFDELVQQGKSLGPFQSRCSTNQDDHALIMHTSGSTGAPKPIPLTNGFLSLLYPSNAITPPQGRQSANNVFAESHGRFFSTLPLYHVFGIISMIRSIIAADNLIMSSPDRPPNAAAITAILRDAQPKAGAFAPSLLEEICSTTDGLDVVAKIQHIFFGGGPLAHETGDRLCQLTHLQSIIGSTEAGFLPVLVQEDPSDWQYFEWSPGSGLVMEPAGDGLSELVVKKDGDRRGKGIFYTFPDLDEWRTNDLFAPHPEKPSLWTYKGRRDDVIVLSNGEKFNPVGFEKALESHPLVRGAVVVGQARFQTALIVEPVWESLPENMDPASLVDDLWPAIERVNKANPSHGRVWKSMILIAKRNKAFTRAAKGSVIRKRTIRSYEKEIEALYGDEASQDKLGKASPDAGLDQTKHFLRSAIESTGLPVPKSATDDADFFGFGVDSLQVVALSKALTNAFSESGHGQILPQVIYQNPTISALARYLSGDGNDTSASGAGNSREEIMTNMVEKYTAELSPSTRSTRPLVTGKRTVVLTGSTGSLGNYILQDLINSPQVSRVYCMNRSAGATERNRESFEARGVVADFAKVTFLQTDFAKDHFGLPTSLYSELLQNVDTFIHNAWAVDFNKAVTSFEDTHIAGTRRVVDFSIESEHRAHIIFISSIAGVGNWSSTSPASEQVPEKIIEDHKVSLPQGYGESKHVTEFILAVAARKTGVPSTVIRCGQLAGPSDAGSVWNRHEWVPSLLISSRELGMVPQTLGNQNVVDWIPMDVAAKTVCELTISRSSEVSRDVDLARAYHIVNPRIVQWTDLVPSILRALQEQTDKPVKSVTFEAWLEALRNCPVTTEEMEKKPAIKLLDFYEGLSSENGALPRLATGVTEENSDALRSVDAISADLVRAWIKMW